MSTRCLTRIYDGDAKKEFVCIYRHCDGYPEGMGADLRDLLEGMILTNGIPLGYKGKLANGPDCLAAQIVAHFKDGAGHIYLEPASTKDMSEEYEYHVRAYRANGLGEGRIVLEAFEVEGEGKRRRISPVTIPKKAAP